jgi:hypothetical protein
LFKKNNNALGKNVPNGKIYNWKINRAFAIIDKYLDNIRQFLFALNKFLLTQRNPFTSLKSNHLTA